MIHSLETNWPHKQPNCPLLFALTVAHCTTYLLLNFHFGASSRDVLLKALCSFWTRFSFAVSVLSSSTLDSPKLSLLFLLVLIRGELFVLGKVLDRNHHRHIINELVVINASSFDELVIVGPTFFFSIPPSRSKLCGYLGQRTINPR